MGKIGKCCCVEGCCLCDEAWTFENWSVTILGKTFTGAFVPADKPDPFTYQNGCSSRQSGSCIIEEPVVLLDCVQEDSWTGSVPVGMNTGQSLSNICYVACPECFCDELPPT